MVWKRHFFSSETCIWPSRPNTIKLPIDVAEKRQVLPLGCHSMDLVTALFLNVGRRWVMLVVKAFCRHHLALLFVLLTSVCWHLERRREPSQRLVKPIIIYSSAEPASRHVQKERARIKENALRQSFRGTHLEHLEYVL
jgi:hypothetical protein